MAQVRRAPQAVDDFEAIAEFISIDSSHYAQLFALDIFRTTERLANFPRFSRVVPELGNSAIREIILGIIGLFTDTKKIGSKF